MVQENQNSLLEYVGKKVSALRRAERLTQKKLAERTGLSLNTIIKIEHAKNKNITIITLSKIAKALKRDIAQFFPEYSALGNDTNSQKIYNDILHELKNTESQFLRFIRRIIRETKKLEEENKRQAKNTH